MKDVYQYFVEGDDEKRLIEVLKTDMFYEKSAKKCHENYIIIVTK